MNKKWLTILAAAVLALFAAFILYRIMFKDIEVLPEKEQPATQDFVPEKNEETKPDSPEVKEEQKSETDMKSTIPAKQDKSGTQEKPKNSVKTSVQNKEQPFSVEIKQEAVETVPEEEMGVIVPVKYVSKSTYKYVYTPKRFNRK